MSLAEFCIEHNLIADPFALECYKQSGEEAKEWQAWVDKHGDSDRQWQKFIRFQYADLMRHAAPNDQGNEGPLEMFYHHFLKRYSLPNNELSWRCYHDSGDGRRNLIDLYRAAGCDEMEAAEEYDSVQDYIRSSCPFLKAQKAQKKARKSNKKGKKP
jgi:hypothetical protein